MSHFLVTEHVKQFLCKKVICIIKIIEQQKNKLFK